jgi:hypothetical protein
MNKKKISKLLKKLESLRRRKGNVTEREIVQFANSCGRKRRAGGMGKEPTYISEHLPFNRPLSIPSHPGNISTGTAGNILSILEQDLFEIEEMLGTRTGGNK